MAQQNAYQEELRGELEKMNPDEFSHGARLLAEELKRVESGDKYKFISKIELHHDRPMQHALKCRIPVKEFPKFNFVGKLLGPKGNTLKRLQEESGCKMSILGRGSVRDKNKEEEMRKEGGKFAHLNDELHVLIEAFAESTDAYQRFAHCITECKKYLVPDHDDDIAMQQMQEMMYINGDKPGRGRGRAGGPPGRGGLLSTPGARGGLAARGAPRGRGALSGRGRAAPLAPVPSPMEASYDDYSGGYAESGYESGYGRGDPYDSSYGGGHGGDTQYFDYGHGTSGGGYDDYGSSSGYGGSSAGYGGSSAGYGGSSSFKSPPSRGRGQVRSHPYGGSGRGGY